MLSQPCPACQGSWHEARTNICDQRVEQGLSLTLAGAGSGATAQPIVSPVYAVPAITHKPGKLTPEAESKLLIHFGLQDTLTREETQALAAQVWQETWVK